MVASRMPRSMLALVAVCLAAAVAPACLSDSKSGDSGERGFATVEPLRPRANPVEYVGMTLEQETTHEALVDLLSRLFGPKARAGERIRGLALQPGITLDVEDDPRTTDQIVVSVTMEPSDGVAPLQRRLISVPVSFEYGNVVTQTVDASLATALGRFANSPGDTDDFFLEYTSTSSKGGRLTLRMDFTAATGKVKQTVKVENAETSLLAGHVNEPAFEGDPFEKIGGTVWFELSRDEFHFFVTRAYGFSAGAQQNFKDFLLLPHEWLRLTVQPRLKDKMVDVQFEVLARDGTRLPLAVAPASFLGGEQFMRNVLRLVDNMQAAEDARPHSSIPWEAPFYYDDPEGGGVVKVLAKGHDGHFRIAYAVESPVRYLQDVQFQPYTANLDIPDELPPPVDTDCKDYGTTDAAQGRLRVTFNASPTIRASTSLKAPLKGNVWGDVYRAADVTLSGPRPGTRALGSFHFENVDITDPAKLQSYLIDVQLIAGEYQLLGFMDIDNTASPTDPGPDKGDPVVLPIGAFKLYCAEQPVTLEFSLLMPY